MVEQTASKVVNTIARLDSLRKVIRNNRVSFPAQVSIFACQHRVEIQWRVVALYFVNGWSAVQTGRRYNVTCRCVQQLLRQWVARARTLGYLKEIPTEKACEVPALSASHLYREIENPVFTGVPPSDVSETATVGAARQE